MLTVLRFARYFRLFAEIQSIKPRFFPYETTSSAKIQHFRQKAKLFINDFEKPTNISFMQFKFIDSFFETLMVFFLERSKIINL